MSVGEWSAQRPLSPEVGDGLQLRRPLPLLPLKRQPRSGCYYSSKCAPVPFMPSMSLLRVSAPIPTAPASTPTPACPPADPCPLAGCERRTKRRLPPTTPKEASLRQRPGGVSVGACCRCGQGNVRDVCVWSGAKISFPESLDRPQLSPPTCNPPF